MVMAATLGLALQARTLKQAVPELRQQLANLQSRTAVMPSHPLPSEAELVMLKRRVEDIDKISNGRGGSLSTFMRKIEMLIPDETYLINLHYKRGNGEALITAESLDVENLTEFLLDLEKEKSFSEVLLNRQINRVYKNKKFVQFEIVIKEHLS